MNKANDIALLYEENIDALFAYGCSLGFDKGVVMDVIHDIFCKLVYDEKRLSEVINIKFYLFRALKNRLCNVLKEKHLLDIANGDLSFEMPFEIKINVEDLLIEREEKQQILSQVEEMLNVLTNRQKEIIYLRYILEYDYEQISDLLGISVHGCRKLVSKSILKLRTKFGSVVLFLFI